MSEGRPWRASLRGTAPVTISKGDPLPKLQRDGILETPVLQAFRWRLPEIVAKL